MSVKVSFIVPIYKVDLNLLNKCLLSIKNQTYKNLEVLIILDGSDLETIEFCKNFSKDDSRFNVISRENKGVSYSRNEGIEKATGDWITFVDADDWVEINMCQLFLDKTKNTISSLDFVMLKNFVNGKEERETKNCIDEDCSIDDNFKIKLFQSTYGTKYGYFSCCEAVWKNFYNREFLLKNEIKFDPSLKIGEDMLFNYQVWMNSNNAYYINTPVYHYRINDQSVMNSNFDKLLSNYSVLFPVFDEKVRQLPTKYSQNNEVFVIRQIERFALNYFFAKDNKYKEFKEFVSDEFYQKKIKNVKLTTLNNSHKLFSLLLKLKMYYFLGFVCLFFNRRRG